MKRQVDIEQNIVLVGMSRRENAAWIRERRLYNLPNERRDVARVT